MGGGARGEEKHGRGSGRGRRKGKGCVEEAERAVSLRKREHRQGVVLFYGTPRNTWLSSLSLSLSKRPVLSRLPHATDLRHIILNCIGIPLVPSAEGHLCTSSRLLCAGQNIYIRQRQTDRTVPVHPGVAECLQTTTETRYRSVNRS